MDKETRLKIYKQIENAGLVIYYNKLLLSFTTWKIGGEAEAFLQITNKDEFIKIFKII